MGGLVTDEGIGLETIRQRQSLTESQTKAFSGDGIDSAGSISDERDIFFPDAPQRAIGGDRTHFRGGGLSPAQARGEFRKFRKGRFQAKARIRRRYRDTDLVMAHRGGISLAAFSPVYFHAIVPRRDTIVAAKGIAKFGVRIGIKIGPTAHAGVGAVGSDDP